MSHIRTSSQPSRGNTAKCLMHTSRLWHAEYTETAMSVDKSAQSVCVDAPDTPEVELCLFYERPFFFPG